MVSVVGADGGVARSRESWSLAPHRARRGGHADLGGKDLVDDAVVLGLLGGHEEIAVAVVLDLLDGLRRGATRAGGGWGGRRDGQSVGVGPGVPRRGGRAVRFGAGRGRGRGERRLAGVVGDVLAQQRADEEDLLGLDLNVRRLQ